MTLGPVVAHHELPAEPLALVAAYIRVTNRRPHVNAGKKAGAAQPLNGWSQHLDACLRLLKRG